MLTITSQAMDVIQRVTGHRALEKTAGVRIARREDPAAPLEVRAVQAPSPGDRVVERDGARLYLGPHTWGRVGGRELHARTDDAGRVQFVVRDAA